MIAFTTNLKLSSTAAFTNWNFNSFTEINGRVLAAGASGLYQVGSNTDDGADINSYLAIGSTDFGIHNVKRFRSLYITCRSDSDLVVTMTVDEKAERQYGVPVTSSGIVTVKVPCGRRQKGSSWSIRIGNVNGGKFSLMSIKGLPVILSPDRK